MTASTERAILAGGCFWGVQDLLRRYPGVISTRVGYSGGDVPNATYRNHGTHAEAIEVIFDPKVMSYRKLLEFFFQIHDPTTLNRQGNDRGLSYRSAIFYTSEEQKETAEDTIADVDASGLWPGKVPPRAIFGKRSRSTRTTWSVSRTATPATSCGLNGNSPFGRPKRPPARLESRRSGRSSVTTVHAKREQHITRLAGDAAVAGIHVHHAAGDGGPAVVQRTARPGNAIHRVE
jgi:peptide-methionine (S)-S-oxide reductase